MRVRRLEKKDFISTRPLYEEVFQEDSACFVDYYYETKAKRSTAFVVENNEGEQIAMLHLNPYVIQVREGERFESIPACYIVAVATRQQYRHQGCMRRLLQEAENFCKEKGIPVLFLMPADPEIYKPFGYKYIFSRPEFYFSKEWKNPRVRLELCGMEDGVDNALVCRKLAALAGRALEKQFDFFVKRDEQYYVNIIKELRAQKGEIGIYYYDDEMVGYYTKTGEEPNLFCGRDCIGEALFTEEFSKLYQRRKGLPILQSQEKHPIIMAKAVETGLSSYTFFSDAILKDSVRGWIIEIV